MEFELKKKEGEQETFIELNKLLKVANVVESGAMANQVIVDGLVLRNGVPELRKRAKIKSGETIEFQGEKINVI